jgi:chromosome segregation ATPase
MLETIFRNGGERKQTQDELRALVLQARNERVALRNLLEQTGGMAEKVAKQSQALAELGAKTDLAMLKIDKLELQSSTLEAHTGALGELQTRLDDLMAEVLAAKRAAEAAGSSGGAGDLGEHRQVMEDLDEQAREAHAVLTNLRREHERFEELRKEVRQSSADIVQAAEGVAALKGQFDALRSAEAGLREEMHAVRSTARAAHDDSTAAADAVKDVESRLAAFAELQELSKTTEKRLTSLNALAEHVSHKAKALETQRHTVEHAVVEATRLNEMVWNMDAQIA